MHTSTSTDSDHGADIDTETHIAILLLAGGVVAALPTPAPCGDGGEASGCNGWDGWGAEPRVIATARVWMTAASASVNAMSGVVSTAICFAKWAGGSGDACPATAPSLTTSTTCMCIFVYVCKPYIDIHTCRYVYIQICMYGCIYMYIYTDRQTDRQTHTHTYIHVHTHMNTPRIYIDPHTRTHT